MNAPASLLDLFFPDCAEVLRRLRARGFDVRTREEAREVGQWLRFTPMLQALLFGLGTFTASVELLSVMAGLLAVGVVAGSHPFDLIYTGIIRQLETAPEHPRCSARRRLVFLVGFVLCVATAWSFAHGRFAAGYLIGGVMIASTAFLAATHICIPSLVVGWLGRTLRLAE